MKDPQGMTNNRTGILTSPRMAKEMIDGTVALSPPGGAEDLPLDAVRATYLLDAEPAGTMPPPAPGAPPDPSKGIVALLDALGARLAFERTGTRLYEALLSKVGVFGAAEGGPTEADLAQIWNDELAHFQLLQDTIFRLGGDPTAVTPSANVQGIASAGPLQIVTDPRFTVLDSLQAALIVELADRDSWELLIGLADATGQADLVDPFCAALAAEEQHLASVRAWIATMTEHRIRGGAPAPPP